VVVALVVVEFIAVKDWKVEEPVAQKFRVLRRPELESVVEVAEVVVERVINASESVDDAVEINPLLNSSVVEVAFSPVASFTNG